MLTGYTGGHFRPENVSLPSGHGVDRGICPVAFLFTHDGGELFFVFPDVVGAVVISRPRCS